MKNIRQVEFIKDVRNIETIINSGYGLDVMNEKRINMTKMRKQNKKSAFLSVLAAMFV